MKNELLLQVIDVSQPTSVLFAARLWLIEIDPFIGSASLTTVSLKIDLTLHSSKKIHLVM
jgi:hypothetical protein